MHEACACAGASVGTASLPWPDDDRAVERQSRQTRLQGLGPGSIGNPLSDAEVGCRTADGMPRAAWRAFATNGHLGPDDDPKDDATAIVDFFALNRTVADAGTSAYFTSGNSTPVRSMR